MRKFKCTKKWARNTTGDIVEEYMLRRYPVEIQRDHFVEVVDKPKKSATKSNASKTTATKTGNSSTI